MMVKQAAILAAMLALAGQPAFAQSSQPTSREKGPASKRIRTHGAPRPEASAHPLSDFIKGSAEQQELERRDNDLATMRPVDHTKDDFFSDWRGIR